MFWGRWMKASVPWNTLWEMFFHYEVMVSLVSEIERINFEGKFGTLYGLERKSKSE